MSGVQIFRNAEFGAVRIVDVTGEPWFDGPGPDLLREPVSEKGGGNCVASCCQTA